MAKTGWVFLNSLKYLTSLTCVSFLCVPQPTPHFQKKAYFLAKVCSSTMPDFYLTGIKKIPTH